LWVLSFWLIPVTVVLAPIAVASPLAFFMVWTLVLWLLYPLSLLSALYTQNWFFFMHPVILWRMMRHYRAFAYVHLLTLASASVCAYLLYATFTQNVLWGGLAMLVLPASILFYARHWGRFAWLALNFEPRKKKVRRTPKLAVAGDGVPELDVEEIDPADEGIRAGAPPDAAQGLRAGVPVTPDGVIASSPAPAVHEEVDEWADTKPYGVIDDVTVPSFDETAPTPQLVPVAAHAPAPVVEEEEDEWATNKKPYEMIGNADFKPPAATDEDKAKPEADKPLPVSKYYDDRHHREKDERRKAQAEDTLFGMPAPSKKTPTFADALFFGVWGFMIQERTLTVWANMVVLTMVELVFVYLAVSFFPRLPD